MKQRVVHRTLVLLASICAAFLCVALVFFAWYNAPIDPASGSVLFTVPRGASVMYITESLREEGMTKTALVPYLYVRVFGISMRAGTYRLSPAMSSIETVKYISTGKEETVRVTIPEGLSLLKTAVWLENAGVVSAAAFSTAARNREFLAAAGIPSDSAEGYLFPDTYFFSYGIDAATVVRIMTDNFFAKASKLAGYPESNDELFEKVILASIIEREYRVAEEAPLIASVFNNRTEIGMGLQSCATIEYIITELQGKPHPLRLTNEDLDIPSDYNTYLWAGLPPGPISNPGLIALAAAFEPADTSWLYFRLVDSEKGTHAFTRSLEEHVRAGRQLLLKKAVGD